MMALSLAKYCDKICTVWIDLAQHQTFNAAGAPGLVIALDYDGAEADVAGGGFEARGHAAEEALDYQLLLYADDAVVGAGHADVGDVGGALGQNVFIGGG